MWCLVPTLNPAPAAAEVLGDHACRCTFGVIPAPFANSSEQFGRLIALRFLRGLPPSEFYRLAVEVGAPVEIERAARAGLDAFFSRAERGAGLAQEKGVGNICTHNRQRHLFVCNRSVIAGCRILPIPEQNHWVRLQLSLR